MSSVEIDYCGEGGSDAAIARALIAAAGATPGRDYFHPKKTGKAALAQRVQGLNAGVVFGSPVLILRDLDQDAPCAGALVGKLVAKRHPRCMIRIAVPSAESWLMADRDAYAAFCGVSIAALPGQPEKNPGLKTLILGWVKAGKATKLSRHMKEARGRGVPDWQSLGEWHADFARSEWDPIRAAKSGLAPSLTRALGRLREIVAAECRR